MPRLTHVPRRKGVAHLAPTETKVVERFDPNEDFSDVNGSHESQFKLENERSDRKYCWPTDTMEDRQRFQGGSDGIRWIPETYAGDEDPKALRPVGSFGLLKKGDLIRVGVHVLMSCDRAVWEKRRRYEATLTQEGRKMAAAHRSEGPSANVYAGKHTAGWQGLDGVNSAMQE